MEHLSPKNFKITNIVIWIILENLAALIGLIVTGLAQLDWYFNVLLMAGLSILLSLTLVYNYGKVIEGVAKLTTNLATDFTSKEESLREIVNNSKTDFSKQLSDQAKEFDRKLAKHSSEVKLEVKGIEEAVKSVKFVLTANPQQTAAVSATNESVSPSPAEISPSHGK